MLLSFSTTPPRIGVDAAKRGETGLRCEKEVRIDLARREHPFWRAGGVVVAFEVHLDTGLFQIFRGEATDISVAITTRAS